MENNVQDNTGSEQEKYIVHIKNFDGPLDLLWELIKKAKIDITEISISDITEQFLSYLKYMDSLNVKIAIEFIWMASELLYYKSKALLPSSDIDDEYFVPPLPPELIQKLLEYKKYQQAADRLREEFDRQNNMYFRNNNIEETIGREDYLEVSLFDLLKAFADVLEAETTVEHEEIVFDEILVSDRIEHIIDILKENDVIIFTEILEARPSRAHIVASFLAILEMTKTRMIKVMQHRVFGDIRIFRNFSLEDLE